jgi:two-component system, OmpR family, sensor kinase
MSIKARLLLSISLVVLVALILIGTATVSITRNRLISRVDATLVAASSRPPRFGDADRGPAQTSGKRATASIVMTAAGQQLVVEPSGFADDPDPIPAITLEQLRNNTNHLFTTRAEDGSHQRFRVLIRPLTDNVYYVTAAPLTEVNETVRNLALVILVTGLVVLVLLIGVVWATIRNGLRPIDSMIATAGMIGGGDLSRRIDTAGAASEVGQLGQALNDMLSQIEASFEAREASERRLRLFVADASHELRTPLTSIRGYAELYRSGASRSPEGIERVMARIEAEGARMSHMVEDLLLLARLDQGRPLQWRDVDLVELIGLAIMDAQAASTGHQITFHHPDRAQVAGDPEQLRQVFDNLLTNARVHSSPDTRITVTIETIQDIVRVLVQDDGPGIAPEHVERVFDRFYRADDSRARASGGSGLGLSIVKSIVTAHGGSVALVSVPGQGTTVTVTLNRRAGSPPVEHPA